MTKIKASMACTINTGNFSNVKIEIEVEDHKRESDKSVADAIERVYGMVESKVTEKAAQFDTE